MTDVTTPPEETMTIRVSLLDKLFDDVKARAFEDGKREATGIQLSDDFGTTSWLTTISAPSRTQLRRAIAERRWRNEGDNPGAAFLGTCEVLRIIRRNGEWRAIVIVSTHYDV